MKEDFTPRKRNRIAKACNYCRKKKVKCDGNNPCSNCSNSKSNECIYPSDADRKTRAPRTINKKITKENTIKDLGSRLEKLENLIVRLTNKLDSSEDDMSTSNEPSEAGKSSVESNSNRPESNDNDKKKNSYQLLEQYYGTHSLFNIFSKESIKWIQNKLGPDDSHLCVPLENLPLAYDIFMNTFVNIFMEPKFKDEQEMRSLMIGSFPSNKQLVFELLEHFDSIFLASYLCDVKLIKELFGIYYYNEEQSNINKSRKLKYSELLIMNISLALCIISVVDERSISSYDSTPSSVSSNQQSSTLSSSSIEDLIALQGKCFNNSIFYYERISVISDGIRTIQAILLLIIYLETSWVNADVNYILLSITIRFSQEIGLHRYESFNGLSNDEQNFRRRLWWFCQYFDMEVCYRSGKPPLINGSDVSTLTEKDSVALIDESQYCDEHCESGTFDVKLLNNVAKVKGVHSYNCHFLLLLTRIRSKSYTELFSASAQHLTFESLTNTLNSLNKDMFTLADSINRRVRPRFYNDPEFSKYSINSLISEGYDVDSGQENVLTIQLTFFLHLMTINRLPFQISCPDHDESCNDSIIFRHLSLESARTILYIVKGLDRAKTRFSCVNWVIFFPFAAFLNLLGNCLHRPNAPETFDDVNLLIDVSINFFAYHNRFCPNKGMVDYLSRTYNQRESLCDMISRTMLRILIKVMETRTNHNFLENNEKLKIHLDSCEKMYPDLFVKSSKDFQPDINIRFSEYKNGNTSNNGITNVTNNHITNKNSYKGYSCADSTLTSNSATTSSQFPTRYQSLAMSSAGYITVSNKQNSPNFNNIFLNDINQGRNRQPFLSNILHPTDNLESSSNNLDILHDPFMSENFNDDSLRNMLYSQVYSLPNYFFDNNLGT